MADVLMAAVRKQIIDQINSAENRRRKNESIRRFDIYNKRQAPYVREQLAKEYSQETVKDMRIISSINLGRRIIDKMSSLYREKPTRTFSIPGGRELTQNEQDQLNAIYETSGIDLALKKSNRYYKLEQQGCIQIIPREGKIKPRVLLPHHYDVIPKAGDPEEAEGYVISVYDKSLLYNDIADVAGGNYLDPAYADGINQIIGDRNDDQELVSQRFIWWTADWNFVTDGRGNLVNEQNGYTAIVTDKQLDMLRNPIGMLPFVDIACEKEFEFWVRQGNDVIDFALDFSVLLSDTAEINKRQGYSQAIVYSEEPPKDMLVGPNRILHVKLDRDSEQQSKFEWSNPSPDMQSALALLENYLSLFLTSQGIDPKTITGKGESQRFSSGFERLLAMIDQFEASADDMELYRHVEHEILEIFVAWSNALQGATIQAGTEPLEPRLNFATIPADVQVTVAYVKPQAAQSQAEVEDGEIKKLEAGLTTRKRAIMKIEGIDEKAAEELITQIDQDGATMPTPSPGGVNGADTTSQI